MKQPTLARQYAPTLPRHHSAGQAEAGLRITRLGDAQGRSFKEITVRGIRLGRR